MSQEISDILGDKSEQDLIIELDQEIPTMHDSTPTLDNNERVCSSCSEDNLIKPIGIRYCNKCQVPYCIHYASGIDPEYCHECLREVEVETSVITKTTEHFNENTQRVYTKKQTARQIKFGGQDWLFHQRKISTLDDAELDIAIEYHHAIYSGMIYEREDRRISSFHRNAKISSSGVITVDKNTTTTVKDFKKQKITQKSKKDIDLIAILQKAIASGLTVDQLKAMVK